MSQKRHLNSKNQGQMQETSFKSEKGDIAESSRLLSRTKATLYVNYILMPVIVVIIAGLLTYFASKNTDSQTSGASRAKKPKSNVLFTVEELAKHDGSDPNIPIYIAILGRVYNVDKGRRHYTIGSGYNVFAGRDSTPSFVTGLFSREKATDNVKGMTPEDMLGIKDWLDFYRRDYTYVGKLIGRYYDHDGNPTQALKEAKVLIKEGQRLKKLQEDENKRFPGCNSKWSIEEGSMVWCSKNSAGIQRDWVGVPRKMFKPGKKDFKCVCVRTSGPSSDAGDGDEGDLNNPIMQAYPGCGKYDFSCKLEG